MIGDREFDTVGQRAVFSEQGFRDFNREYVRTLERWGIYRDGVNPVARTNVCPVYEAPAEPVLYAFSYTVPAPGAQRGSFIIAGSGEARGGALQPHRDGLRGGRRGRGRRRRGGKWGRVGRGG